MVRAILEGLLGKAVIWQLDSRQFIHFLHPAAAREVLIFGAVAG